MNEIPDLDDNLEKFKMTLTRFHSIIVIDQKDPEPLTLEKLKNLKDLIYENLEKDEMNKIIENFLEIRIYGLKIRPEKRMNFINDLIEIDLFNNKNEENHENIGKFLDKNNHNLNTCVLSLISMLCGCQEGINYVCGGFNKNEILEKIFQVFFPKFNYSNYLILDSKK